MGRKEEKGQFLGFFTNIAYNVCKKHYWRECYFESSTSVSVVGVKVLLEEGLQVLSLRKGQGLPCAEHSGVHNRSPQQMRYGTQLSTTAKLVAPLAKHT